MPLFIANFEFVNLRVLILTVIESRDNIGSNDKNDHCTWQTFSCFKKSALRLDLRSRSSSIWKIKRCWFGLWLYKDWSRIIWSLS